MVFLVWLVGGLPAIANHSTEVRHAHNCWGSLFKFSHTCTHASGAKPMQTDAKTKWKEPHTQVVQADLAQQWETTGVASASRLARCDGQTGRDHFDNTHSVPSLRQVVGPPHHSQQTGRKTSGEPSTKQTNDHKVWFLFNVTEDVMSCPKASHRPRSPPHGVWRRRSAQSKRTSSPVG